MTHTTGISLTWMTENLRRHFTCCTYPARPSRSTVNSAGTGQLPPAGQSSPEPASCRSLLLGRGVVCPERIKPGQPMMQKNQVTGSVNIKPEELLTCYIQHTCVLLP